MTTDRKEHFMPRLYVGNLASSVTSDDLIALFSRAGEVRGALAVSDKTSGLCRGFGFVEMVHHDDAAAAIELLEGAGLNGQQILIDPDSLKVVARATLKTVPKRRLKNVIEINRPPRVPRGSL
jgi:RNA recognition motif-containing protein